MCVLVCVCVCEKRYVHRIYLSKPLTCITAVCQRIIIAPVVRVTMDTPERLRIQVFTIYRTVRHPDIPVRTLAATVTWSKNTHR